MMIELHALSLAPAAREWLQSAIEPRVLHVFDRACNLIDSRGDVLSIVTPSIGNGPFSIVVPIDRDFSSLVTVDSKTEVGNWGLEIGTIRIDLRHAQVWQPRPRWAEARRANVIPSDPRERGISITKRTESLFNEVTSFQNVANDLGIAIANNDLETCRRIARQLAGLGIGLTPSGDDFLIGTMYAVWLSRPAAEATLLTQAMADEAAPLTTSLSAAWLRAASRGEANVSWHALIDALIDRDRRGWSAASDRILDTGYTSGADALSGFFSAARAMTETPAAALRSTF